MMSCTSCVHSSRTALRRVFLSSALEPSAPQLRHLHLLPSLRLQHQAHDVSSRRYFTGIKRVVSREPPNPDFQRNPRIDPQDPVLHTSVQSPTRDSRSVRAHQPKQTEAPPGSPPRPKPSKTQGLPRDAAIAEITDHIILRREDGHLTEPRALSAALLEAQLRDQTIVTIALPRPGGGPRYPICIVLDRQSYEESERQRLLDAKARAEDEKRRKKGTKELEINWAIDPHDLEHKMKRFREFLEKGLKVEMLLLRKNVKKRDRGKKQASHDEAELTLGKVREVAAEVGAKEIRSPIGTVGERLQLVFEGPR